jgi:AraC-like DNA-binding protein
LEEEGTSFRELTQAALHEAACSMLRNPAVTLQSVAHALGFSDSSAFHRAFRRWCALTPAEYRNQFLGDAESASDARCC